MSFHPHIELSLGRINERVQFASNQTPEIAELTLKNFKLQSKPKIGRGRGFLPLPMNLQFRAGG